MREKESPILTLEEAASYLHKSKSWVYKNWEVIGGVKLRGSLFFPRKEELYELIFQKRQGMDIRLHPERNQAYSSRVQDKNRGERSRSKEKGGDKKSEKGNGDPNRHGLLGTGK